MTASNTPQTTAAAFCLCGCNQVTSAKANYRPGHDAAHVSRILATIIDQQDLSQSAVDQYRKELPSLPLQIKLQNAVDKFARKSSAKSTARPRSAGSVMEWVGCDTDEYRKGRWTYPVQAMMRKDQADSEYYGFRRNTKRDGSGEWVEVTAEELSPR